MRELKRNLPDKKFKWRTKGGEFYKPHNMTTHHLFFTIRMIWNHSVPEHMQIKPFKKYILSDFYDREYLIKAVYNLALELSTRDDLTSYYKESIKVILLHLEELNKVMLLEAHG